MARLMFTYNMPQRTPVANPETLWQIVAAANHRVALHAVEMMPLGSTGASAPIEFEMVIQDGAGTSAAGSFVSNSPAAAETIQTAMRQVFTAEPATNTRQYEFSLHQQGSRIWTPPNPYKEIVIAGGVRWGLRVLDAISYPIAMCLHLEE